MADLKDKPLSGLDYKLYYIIIYLIEEMKSKNMEITHEKIECFLYLIQGYNLLINEDYIFPMEFSSPRIKSVIYFTFKEYQKNGVPNKMIVFDEHKESIEFVTEKFKNENSDKLKKISFYIHRQNPIDFTDFSFKKVLKLGYKKIFINDLESEKQCREDLPPKKT